MFFHINEKTLKDIIENQQKREQEVKDSTVEYDGHKLRFIDVPGGLVIDADPPLVKEIEGDKTAPAGDVDVLTPTGWRKKT